MKSRFNISLFILLFPTTIFSRQELNKEQILEDYNILKNILEKGHPNLYEYTSKSEWDSLFIHFEKEKVKTIQNDSDLFKSITELTDHVKDGHLMVIRPQLDLIPKLFPLLLKIINEKLYTDTDDFGIPVGSEIVSIDGVDGATLRERLLKYAPADGSNTTKKDRQIEREFGILHFYEFGAKSTYQVEYKTPFNQIVDKNIESQSFESIGKRFAKRNSFFDKKNLGKREPFLHFIDSLNTAVLTMNTFHLEAAKFQSILKEIFKEIKRKKSKNLIIDIRQNQGGYPLNAIKAFSYIASKPFKQRLSSEVVTSTLPEKRYSLDLVNGYTYETFFKQYYEHAEKQESKWLLSKDENEALMIPNKKRFAGKVYVLMGGQTFSAGSSFALFCKNEGITLLGEEAGGGYYTQTGGYPIMYTLPHSKIKIYISFVKVNRFVENKTVKKGKGILPDEKVHLTVQDLIQRKDSVLDYVLKQIKINEVK